MKTKAILKPLLILAVAGCLATACNNTPMQTDTVIRDGDSARNLVDTTRSVPQGPVEKDNGHDTVRR